MVTKQNLHTEDFVLVFTIYATIYLFIKRYQIRFLQQNLANFNHFRIESFIFKGKNLNKICENLSRFFFCLQFIQKKTAEHFTIIFITYYNL